MPLGRHGLGRGVEELGEGVRTTARHDDAARGVPAAVQDVGWYFDVRKMADYLPAPPITADCAQALAQRHPVAVKHVAADVTVRGLAIALAPASRLTMAVARLAGALVAARTREAAPGYGPPSTDDDGLRSPGGEARAGERGDDAQQRRVGREEIAEAARARRDARARADDGRAARPPVRARPYRRHRALRARRRHRG